MKVTADVITKIQMALSDLKMNQTELARRLGWHRSNVSRLLKGEIETMTRKVADDLNDILKIDLMPAEYPEEVSPTVLRLSEMAQSDPKIASLLELVLNLSVQPPKAFLPQVDTKKLPKVGAAITTIVHRWEQHSDPHYSKIAVEVLDWLRTYYTKGMP